MATSEADDTSGDGESSDLFGDGSGQQLDFDIEAFPMEADDRDGIVNMLTQVLVSLRLFVLLPLIFIYSLLSLSAVPSWLVVFASFQVFLQADIDLSGLADAVIAQSPFGIVIGVSVLLFFVLAFQQLHHFSSFLRFHSSTIFVFFPVYSETEEIYPLLLF